MNTAVISQRQTKYCLAIESILAAKGHATNTEILKQLHQSFPGLSATTVHRATSRLASRGKIGVAPPTRDGSMQYDANPIPHDHFQCSACGILRDTHIKDKLIPILKASIDGCSISGQLTINGTCKNCTTEAV